MNGLDGCATLDRCQTAIDAHAVSDPKPKLDARDLSERSLVPLSPYSHLETDGPRADVQFRRPPSVVHCQTNLYFSVPIGRSNTDNGTQEIPGEQQTFLGCRNGFGEIHPREADRKNRLSNESQVAGYSVLAPTRSRRAFSR